MFNIEKAIIERKSVRTYEPISIDTEILQTLTKNCLTVNPFKVDVNVQIMHKDLTQKAETLGTYGIIKGAHTFLGAKVKNDAYALEACGYVFERCILEATSLHLGSCFIGGTFNRSQFEHAFNVNEDELFPVVSPLGIIKDQRRLTDQVFRTLAKSDRRKAWEDLFFENDFEHPLQKENNESIDRILESVRLAPSASNKQPWRILKINNDFHFYLQRTAGYAKALEIDLQRVDMGIAASHFDLMAQFLKLKCELLFNKEPILKENDQKEYCFTFTLNI